MSEQTNIYHGQKAFAPILFTPDVVSSANRLAQSVSDAHKLESTTPLVSLGLLTDSLWRTKHVEQQKHASDIPLVILAQASNSQLRVTASQASSCWRNLLWPQALFSSRQSDEVAAAVADLRTYEDKPAAAIIGDDATPSIPADLARLIVRCCQPVDMIHVVLVTDVLAVLSILFRSAPYWAAYDLARGNMWTRLQLHYESQLSSLLVGAPKFARFWNDLERLEGKHLYRFGGCLRDILSGDALRCGGDAYFAKPERADSSGGDVDMYLHRPKPQFADFDYFGEQDDDDKDDKAAVECIPLGTDSKQTISSLRFLEGQAIESGTARTYVGGTDTLGPQPSARGQELFKRRYAHWSNVVFGYTETASSDDDDFTYKVRSDVFLRSCSTDETYFEYELAMCDFDVNRLVEHQGRLHLRAFVRSICPYLEEEREHLRLYHCFQSRTFGFAQRDNPARANPPDSRLLFRWLRMTVTKGWTLDMTDADNVRCIGSLWLNMFLSVFDEAKRHHGAGKEPLFFHTNWAEFFSVSHTQTAPNVSNLTRHWTPDTGSALARWLMSGMVAPSNDAQQTECCLLLNRSCPFAGFLALSWQWWIELAAVCKSTELWQVAARIPSLFAVLKLKSEDCSVGDTTRELLGDSFAGVWAGCRCKSWRNGSCSFDPKLPDPCQEWAQSKFNWSSVAIVRREEERQLEDELSKLAKDLRQQIKEVTLLVQKQPPSTSTAEHIDSSHRRSYDDDDDDDDDRRSRRPQRPVLSRSEQELAKLSKQLGRACRQLDDLGSDYSCGPRFYDFTSSTLALPCIRQSILTGLFSQATTPATQRFQQWIHQQGLWSVLLDTYASDFRTQLLLGLVLGQPDLLETQWKATIVDSKAWLVSEHVVALERELQEQKQRHHSEEWRLRDLHRQRLRDATEEASKLFPRQVPVVSASSGAERKRERKRLRIIHAAENLNASELAAQAERHKDESEQIAQAQTALRSVNAAATLEPLELVLDREWFLMLTTSPHTSAALVRRALDLYDATFGGPGSFARVHGDTLFSIPKSSISSYGCNNSSIPALCSVILASAPVQHVAEIITELHSRQCLDVGRLEITWKHLSDSSLCRDDVKEAIARDPRAIVKALAALTSLTVKSKAAIVYQLCRHAPSLVSFYAQKAFPDGHIVEQPTRSIIATDDAHDTAAFDHNAEYELGKLLACGLVHPADRPVITGNYYNRADQLLFDTHPLYFEQLLWFCGHNFARLELWLIAAYDARVTYRGCYRSGSQIPLLHYHAARTGILARQYGITSRDVCQLILGYLGADQLKRLI
jgi:hypothetical protein